MGSRSAVGGASAARRKRRALLHSIVTNFGRVDRNKRLGRLATAVFLEWFGEALWASPTAEGGDYTTRAVDHAGNETCTTPISITV